VSGHQIQEGFAALGLLHFIKDTEMVGEGRDQEREKDQVDHGGHHPIDSQCLGFGDSRTQVEQGGLSSVIDHNDGANEEERECPQPSLATERHNHGIDQGASTHGNNDTLRYHDLHWRWRKLPLLLHPLFCINNVRGP